MASKRSRMRAQKANMADWTRLPNDAFSQITSRLPCLEDFSRLSTVCKSWNFSADNSDKPSLSLKSPVLMLVEEKDADGQGIKVKAYEETTDLSSRFMLHVWRLEMSPPQTRCLGVKYGWLLTLGRDLKICLVHPISECQIQLPPCPNSDYLLDPQYHIVADSDRYDPGVVQLPRLRNTLLWKAALSSNPLENIPSRSVSTECVVMGVFSDLGMLAFARLQDKAWTVVKSVSHNFVDVIYFRGKFCAVNNVGELFVCEIDGENPRAIEIASVETLIRHEKFLVELSGDLFLGIRDSGSGINRSVPVFTRLYPQPPEIKVYKLEKDRSEENGFWFRRRYNLGNKALMLGASSVGLDAPGIKGCFKHNHVFVTDDTRIVPPYGMDVFDLGDGNSEEFNFSRMVKHSLSSSCPPFWYM